jgi:hypothetical protein
MKKLIIGVMLVGLLFGCSKSTSVYKESTSTFDVFDKAYKEHRPLSKSEVKKIEDFKKFSADWKKKHFALDGLDLTKEEQKDAKLIQHIDYLVNLYRYFGTMDNSDLKKFKDMYKETKGAIQHY